jgi:ketosteroid isomerase-like protein
MNTKWQHALLMAFIFLVAASSCTKKAEPTPTANGTSIDLVMAGKEIEFLDKQFSDHIKNGDSVAVADMYASDGTLGSIKGREDLIAAWGRMIRYGISNGTPMINYITNALTTDNEFVVELGTYQYLDSMGNVKSEGKYVVVWKQEAGTWKLYRDFGL